jgi:hypothetical protein
MSLKSRLREMASGGRSSQVPDGGSAKLADQLNLPSGLLLNEGSAVLIILNGRFASADQVPHSLPGHLEDDACLRGCDPGMPKHARLAEHSLADWQVSHVIRCHAPKPDTSNWPLPGPVRRPSDRPTCPLRLAAAPERNLAQCLVIGAHVRNWLAHSSSRSCGAEPIPGFG